MLKQIILWFLLLLSINLSAQQVSFEPVFINQTTREIDTTIIFSIYNQNDSGITWNEFSNIIELPDTGRYKMAIIVSGVVYDIEINKYGYFSDTFNTPLIHVKAVIGEHLPTRYYYYDYKYYGDSACDGYITDFYYNGNIRLIGRFSNGYPIDTIKQYYDNGVLKYMDYYSHNKIIHINQPYPYRTYYHWEKQFDKDGRLICEADNKAGKKIYYYPNGNHKEILDFNNRNNYEEYYENGNPKILIKDEKKKRISRKWKSYLQAK